MPISESAQAQFGAMWIMVVGIIVCILYKSPFAFLFMFGLLFCFFGLVRQLTEGLNDKPKGNEEVDEMELQPLGRVSGDMTLGEVLARY